MTSVEHVQWIVKVDSLLQMFQQPLTTSLPRSQIIEMEKTGSAGSIEDHLKCQASKSDMFCSARVFFFFQVNGALFVFPSCEDEYSAPRINSPNLLTLNPV